MPKARCPRCAEQVGDEDRYCRACGYALNARPDFALDLHGVLLEAVPVGIFTLDLEARIRFWNRAMETQFGRRRRDVLGRVLFEVLPHLQPYAHSIVRVSDNALPYRLDQVSHGGEADTPLTETFWFGPLLLDDGSGAILGVMEDITQRVRVDDQLIRSERLAAIGELAAGVAHNFNNILAAIGGDAQLLKMAAEEENLPPHVIEAAQQICDETMRGGRIAHDLLSFARGADPQLQRLDLGEVIRDAVRLIRNHPAARAVEIQPDVRPDLPEVEADPNLLHQVFFNLMLNALQAMPQGGTLHISSVLRSHETDPTSGVLDLKFHDTGVGIPKEHLRRIFDPFYSRRAGGGSGSGLGLPVSLAMIKSVGGNIQVASVEGFGTTVTVSLPIVERRSVRRTGSRSGQQPRALIVDDDANVRRTLATLLTRRGLQVVTAPDGEEGLERWEEALAERPFDMVLLEINLPRGDSAAFCRRVQSSRPGVPVLVLTGVTDPYRLNEVLESGARFSFGKPPNFSELLSVVEALAHSDDEPEDAGPQKGCQFDEPSSARPVAADNAVH